MLIIIILHSQTLVLELRPFSLIHNSLMMYILHSRPYVFRPSWYRLGSILVFLRDQTKTVKQRRRHSTHWCVITRSAEVEKTQARGVDLIFWWSDYTMDGRFYEPFRVLEIHIQF